MQTFVEETSKVSIPSKLTTTLVIKFWSTTGVQDGLFNGGNHIKDFIINQLSNVKLDGQVNMLMLNKIIVIFSFLASTLESSLKISRKN